MAAVSIIVPVYRAEATLRRCADSLLSQTLQDIELILVDDGSPDGSGAICDEYAKKDSRVRVIHKENGGPVSARKAGIAASTAELIGFADSDDWAEPRFYEDLYQGILRTGADVVTAEIVYETDPPAVRVRPQQMVFEGEQDIRRLMEMLFLNCLEPAEKWLVSYAMWDKLFRRELLTKNLPYFNERVFLDEDRLANIALLADCRKVVLLSDTARYHYCVTEGSVSARVDEALAGTLEEYVRTLLAIVRAKHLEEDREPVDILIGSTAYRRIYRTAALAGVPAAERRARIRKLLSATPPGTLGKFARARGGLFIRLFCAMLQAGLVGPCTQLVTLHAVLSGVND